MSALVSLFLAALIVIAPIERLYAQADAAGEDVNQFVIANTQFTLLHELGHVLITELNIPILGREEDAADELAAVALLLPRDGRRDTKSAEKLMAAAEGWLIEWHLDKAAGKELEYWDGHPLSIQRHYNILCLAYGSNPEAFKGSKDDALRLPYQRAWWCKEEYRRAVKAMKWVTESYKSQERQTQGKVGVIYEPPTTQERGKIVEILRKSAIIEETAAIIKTHFSFSSSVNIVFANICPAAAYWRKDLGEIIICYGLVERFFYFARFRPCVAPVGAAALRPPRDEEIKSCLAAVDKRE